MARVNEFKADGGAFTDSQEAINRLEDFLKEVQKTGDESSKKLDRDKRYRNNISGLKECFAGVINEDATRWQEIGLDNSFVQVSEELNKDRYAERVMFRHPVYEHVWLTDADGKNVGEELVPFLTYNLEYSKDNGRVTVSVERLETKLNLPELRTSVQAAREDIELLKKETALVGTVFDTAKEVQVKFTSNLEKFCSKNELEWEAPDVVTTTTSSPPGDAIDDVDALQSQEFSDDDSDEPEIIDVEEIGDDDIVLSADAEDDEEGSTTRNKSKNKKSLFGSRSSLSGKR